MTKPLIYTRKHQKVTCNRWDLSEWPYSKQLDPPETYSMKTPSPKTCNGRNHLYNSIVDHGEYSRRNAIDHRRHQSVIEYSQKIHNFVIKAKKAKEVEQPIWKSCWLLQIIWRSFENDSSRNHITYFTALETSEIRAICRKLLTFFW